MRLLITGINGLLGSNLARYLGRRGHTVLGSGRQAVSPIKSDGYLAGELSAEGFAARLIQELKPDAIINCVGLANVNLCEENPLLAAQINVQTSARLAVASAASKLRLLHISTDHLFTGEHSFSHETDEPEPINEYGRSKLGGERGVLLNHPSAAVIRTNFYGWSPDGHSSTFAEWMYKSLADKAAISLYTDYYFNSIEVSALAEALEEVALSDFRGILNIGGAERSSKYDFGKAMADVFGLSMENVKACQFEAEAMRVQRPRDLSLSVDLFKSRFKTHLPTLMEGMQRLYNERRPDIAARR
jgi:dTDP-4-dehydrorhamnose reductase